MHAATFPTANFRRVVRALGALALLTSITIAFAQSADAPAAYAIGVQNAPRAATTASPATSSASASITPADWTLAISGEWATQCPPTLENVSIDGPELRVDARSVLSLCTRRAMPFSIEVNPVLALGQSALAPGVYHVSFYAADGAQAQPKLRAFALVDRSAADAAAVQPEAGFWWSASDSQSDSNNRMVLSMELQNRQLSVALMSYDRSGQPVWNFGVASYDNRIAHVALLRLEGGGDPFSTASAPPHGESVLTLDLQFQSGAHASAWLSRTQGSTDDSTLQVQSLDLVRLPMAEAVDGSAWNGEWVLVDDGTQTPQRLHLDQFQALDASHFELGDIAAGASMVCSRDAARPELPPSSCSLRQGTSAAVSQFDSVAIGRMDGTRADGSVIHLLRVSH
jgi:hypothetical protein